ncbi:MAG TPA: septal ring lytic transglycosylase RlpA family protein [Acidimicrobiales bacterium]|nr:septal ring lytic transglycosylase RlpA family protein [Acidimicrobiales bacterium]
MGLALLFSGAMLAVPLVILHGQASAVRPDGGTTGASAAAVRLGHGRASPVSDEIALVHFSDQRMAATSTTGASTAPSTATGGAVPAPTTSTTPPPTTTTTATTAPPPTTTTTTAPAASATGGATWYTETPAGGCASPWLPRGTELTVTNDVTGARTTCLVDDREADNPGRVVDMSYTTFSEIGNPSAGVLTVTITW